jgi:hypothetical protein
MCIMFTEFHGRVACKIEIKTVNMQLLSETLKVRDLDLEGTILKNF